MIYYPPPTAPQPSAPSTPPMESGARTTTSGRRYQIIFGSVLAGLTILALALAVIAPDLRPNASQATPAGWSQVYASDLTKATASDLKAWDLTKGCAFYSNGLYADASESNGDTVCALTLPGSGDTTDQGFYFELGLAPAAQVPSFQQALLQVGPPPGQSGVTLTFEMDQDGRYVVCQSPCSTASRELYLSGGTAAWHADALVANTIAINVSADHTRETFYVNGQQVETVSVDLTLRPTLAVGAPSGSGAIFTRATLTAGQ